MSLYRKGIFPPPKNKTEQELGVFVNVRWDTMQGLKYEAQQFPKQKIQEHI